MPSLLEAKDLSISFRGVDGGARAEEVHGISFGLEQGSFTSIVGESGSGKTVSALSIARLLDDARCSGQIVYENKEGLQVDLFSINEADLLNIRGGEIAYIFQDPSTSLNPVMSVGSQIAESAEFHLKIYRRPAKERAVQALSKVRFRDPEHAYECFPHELSGGMKQRVMIAMA